MPSYSRVALILVVPALAIAAPRKPKKPTPPPPPAAGSDTAPAAPVDTPSAGSAQPSEPTPPPPSPAAAAETQNKNEPDVDSLRQEYLSLRDELFKSRARANAVASALYSTRIQIKFAWTSGRYYGVNKAQVRLDGATVYEDAGGAIATDDGVRFDGYVAPGRHLVTFHIEATGKDDDTFTSTTESQVVVKAVPQKDLLVTAKAHDGGDIAYAWKKSEHGNYALGIDVSVRAQPPAAKAGK
jgi:hypothetical protein